ncbi:MAG TPA: serine hydrolase domain-containing protein [Puia sp.]|nr:serine hydrolase domain-containing protein [Puia sp.]
MKKCLHGLIPLSILTIFCGHRALGQQIDAKIAQKWNKIFDSISQNNPLPAFYVAMVDKGGICYRYAHGKEIWAKDKALNENSIFRIYSMTKAITTVSVMQLVEKGKVLLDEPMDKWLPDMIEIPILRDDGSLVKSNKTITLRQLLTHTSGFAYSFLNPKLLNFKKPADWRYKDFPRIAEPGVRFCYGTSLDWVGKLIERISGKSLEEYVEENICKPLGMNRTFFTVPDSLIGDIVSFGHVAGDKFTSDEAWQLNRAEIKPKEFNGGGGLFGTVHDYGKFVQCILDGGTLNGNEILQRSTLDGMFTNQIGDLWLQFDKLSGPTFLADTNSTLLGHDKFGLGWAIDVTGRDGLPRGNMYWGGLANTFFDIDPKGGRAVLLFSNVLPWGNKYCTSIYFKALQTIYSLK